MPNTLLNWYMPNKVLVTILKRSVIIYDKIKIVLISFKSLEKVLKKSSVHQKYNICYFMIIIKKKC